MYLFKKNPAFLAEPKVENKMLIFVRNTWKYWWNETICTISLNFEISFLSFQLEIVYGVVSGNFYIFSFQEM